LTKEEAVELDEFVQKVLLDVIKGVKSAQASVNPNNTNTSDGIICWSNDFRRCDVEFDVAVATTESSDGKASVGLRVWTVGGSGERSSSITSEVANRIKFTVPVHLPLHRHS